jgi:hypothetical protein
MSGSSPLPEDVARLARLARSRAGRLECVGSTLHLVAEGGVGGPEVRSRGCVPAIREGLAVGVGGGGEATPEILWVVERLPDETGPDSLAVRRDDAAVGLTGKRGLSDPRDEQGIGEARDHAEQDEGDDGGAELSEHGGSRFT